ncbi:zinc-ribbon domain-containing protein [Halobacillus salinarum]|uniref:Zinc-ribbon domain-containing protein n=1 Tax=Halobacillus salinarum TaxID=2932257 RepID=A0ABY4EFN4_9BACI|nr:zinc ribbon domain-containing protein [Halobacillus salinarum]UOQ43285.1 zinc-ribbon domain-containing protein [Halobacillus salinarum]
MNNCNNCGNPVEDTSRFCSNCGASLVDEPLDYINKPKKIWTYLLPFLALLLSIAAVSYTYYHELHVNEKVLASKQQADELALNGKYEQSEALMAEVVEKRPEHEALQQELSSIRSAMAMNNDLDLVKGYIKDNRLQDAKESLATIQNQVVNQKSRLLGTLSPRINDLDSRITVKEISNELNQLHTIDELAAKLDKLSGLNLEEAGKVRQKISTKIVAIATDKAEKAIDDKQFTEAVNVVDRSLQYVANHEKLVKLKERVIKEKSAFEQAQEERIERAMQQAAEEDLKNKNDAIKILNVKLSKNKDHQVKLNGEVESVATKIVSSVKISYDLLNKKEKVVKSGSTQIYPMYLNPRDKGEFEKDIYGVDGDLSVKITNVEWYVE